jgi:hypothetical protein
MYIFTEAMETFIARVREHPCLWDPTNPNYREKQIRDDAWMNIVIDCNDNSIPSGKIFSPFPT